MSEIKKIYKKLGKKIRKTKSQCQNAACEQKKPLTRNENLIQTKTRSRTSCEWIGKTI